jgi:uncharacterized protein (DUF488 family)
MNANNVRQTVFTIGHSNLELENLISLLKRHGIQAVADVRSSPYSQFNPQFNRETIQGALQTHGIAYVFLGLELGARRTERECYVDGRADYTLIPQTSAFKRGIERVAQGATTMRIALMCAEKDPLECHRCILIAPRLQEQGLSISHILSDGTIENHNETEKRLLHLLDLPENDLFRSPKEILASAYVKQGIRIAYQEEPALREEPPPYGN